MDLLDKLNPPQRQAVTAGAGPVLVLAGPGSGKTRVLTQRVAYLIGSEGVRPYHMLAVTFTNKAAREMESRVRALLGEQAATGLWLGTFHAICARLLRREVANLPFDASFVIYDEDDQGRVVKAAIRDLNLDEKTYRPPAVHAAISRAKNDLIFPADYPTQTYRDEVVKRVYARYQDLLKQSNAVDFDDLLLWTAHLLTQFPAVREKYARRFEHVLVDEFQDTNFAQYTLLKHLASVHNNLFVVGDPDQCFPQGTKILTPAGKKPIQDIQVGERVIAASGRGSSLASQVTHVGKRAYSGDLIKVTTASGHTLQATPNHIVFARLGRLHPGLHYVYLMYRKDKGCRVGIASHARSDGVNPGPQNGLRVHSNSEDADRVWVLKVCDTREAAHYWETYYSVKYGIPSSVFHVRGRRVRMSQQWIDKLFDGIDTTTHARHLLTDLQMDWRYPQFTPQGTFRNTVSLRYFGDGRMTETSPWHAHRVDLWSSDLETAAKLRRLGYNPRIRSRNNWRIGLNRLDYDDVQEAAKMLSQAIGGADIVVGAFLVDKGPAPLAPRFSLMPVSHLHPAMILAVEKGGEIIEDVVSEVTREPFTGDVFDLEVDNLHNYLADGIVVHNSVYRWRGADYRNVQRFEQDYPDCRVILLEQNYRSRQTILDAAMAVIDRAPHRRRKQLFTERGTGEKLFYYEALDDYTEASFVVDSIAQLVASRELEPGDCAVMYRTNAQSRLLEEAFLQARLPYRLVGAQRFYGRREVKDLIAYLRLVHNPADEVSLDRVLNVPPRGVGDKTLQSLHAAARGAVASPAAVLMDLAASDASPYRAQFSGRSVLPLADFGALLAGWRAQAPRLTVAELFDRLVSDVNYRAYIDDGSEEGAERWENVQELRRLTIEYENRTLTDFLENVALISDQDTLSEGKNAPTLLTLHAAKGLEFGAVFIVGLDDGILPHSRSFDDPESMEEERRLFYVGITRAKDRLYLLRALRRGGRGYAEETIPSRFLEDIPSELLAGTARAGRRPRSEGLPSWRSMAAAQPAAVAQARYRAGMRVQHSVWGEGIVLNSRLQDNDETVDVVFESVGIKRLAASLANLKIL